MNRLDLSNNSLVECRRLVNLNKLKRLWIENNLLKHVSLNGLVNLEFLSLTYNRLEAVPDLSDLKKLIYLDLTGNQIKSK
jgi:hypothetical protein